MERLMFRPATFGGANDHEPHCAMRWGLSFRPESFGGWVARPNGGCACRSHRGYELDGEEREIDKDHWYPDRGGAVTRGRKLQQQYTSIEVFQRSDKQWQVRFDNKLPTSTTFPFDDKLEHSTEAKAEARAKVLRVYGYVVTTRRRDSKWYVQVTKLQSGPALLASGPALPTAVGADTGFSYDLEASAKRRADALKSVGFDASVFKRTDGEWQVKIAKLPTFTTGASTSSSSSSSSSSTSTTSASSSTPPNKLVVINSALPAHKLSDAVLQSFKDWADEVRTLTDQDIDANFSDTIRPLRTTGTASSASDSFTWHKTGRTVDLREDLHYVIVKETIGTQVFFRLYLRHKDVKTAASAPRIVKFPAGTTFHYAWWDKVNATWPFVDVTEIARSHGWSRIPAQPGWGTSSEVAKKKQEWWHYDRLDGRTWYRALREIYTDAAITTAIKSFATTNKHAGRLKREGFTETALKALFSPVKAGNVSLRCPVGKGDKAANLTADVTAVQKALIKKGSLATGADTGTLDSATQTAIENFQLGLGSSRPDGLVEVGMKTHKELGKL